MKTKICTLGPAGSFSEAAAKRIFADAETSFESAHRALSGLKKGTFDYAVYPLENNIGGFVNETYDAIYRNANAFITHMRYIAIVQNLICLNEDLSCVDTICSHPQAIAQCSTSIAKLEKQYGKRFRIVKLSSTSEAVRNAAQDATVAAIGSIDGAQHYNVPVRIAGFQDKSRNETRFAVFGMSPQRPVLKQGDTASMYLVEFGDMTRGLSELFALLYAYGIRILSLNHRPVYTRNAPTQYAYFVEIAGDKYSDAKVAAVHKALTLKRLEGQSRKARWVGSYISIQSSKNGGS